MLQQFLYLCDMPKRASFTIGEIVVFQGILLTVTGLNSGKSLLDMINGICMGLEMRSTILGLLTIQLFCLVRTV